MTRDLPEHDLTKLLIIPIRKYQVTFKAIFVEQKTKLDPK